jgi:hypothetical protein
MLSGVTVQFEAVPWETVGHHARQKRVAVENRVLRLLELADGFQETEWCCGAHVGFVVAGELHLTFIDRTEVLRAGDGLVLNGGKEGRHRVTVVNGPVTFFLIEPL